MNSATQAFLGRYRLVKVLGQGAMGVVYEAVDTRLNRTVAIKTVLRSHLVDDATASEYTQRFEREAQAAARLSHPHVVAVYDFGEHEDISYIVMEFIRGRELNQVFESGERVALPEAIRMMRELLEALDYAHRQGVVHRDIKPANVMLDAGDHVKLTDFGVARVASANQDRTMPGTLVGTPSYMSPEQILGTAVGSRADIFAAGVILYQFLTGRKPFSGGGPFAVQRKIVQDDPEPASALNPALPPGFDLIVSRALAKQPEDRYESAAAFSADLARIGGTLAREVPLIDLELDGGPPAAPVPPQPTELRPSTAELPPSSLSLGTVRPFGQAPQPQAEALAAQPPFDPESTVIIQRSRNDANARPAPAAPTLAGPAAAATRPRPAESVAPGRPPAPSVPPPGPPARSGAVGAPPASTQKAPGSTAVQKSAPDPAPVQRAVAGSAPVPAAAVPRRSRAPLALGAAVPLLLLGVWLVVARPWAESGPADAAPPPASAVSPSAVPATSPGRAPMAPAARPSPPPVAQAGAATAPAPAAERTATTATPAPRPGATEASAPAKASRRAAADPGTPRPEPAAAPNDVATRCSDLLLRMQLGEPLTTDQAAFFQSRCTR